MICKVLILFLCVECKVYRQEQYKVTGFQTFGSNNELLISAYFKHFSYLYKNNLKYPSINLFLKNDSLENLITYDISKNGENIFFVQNETQSNRMFCVIKSRESNELRSTTLVRVNQIIISIAFSQRENKIYFIAANDYGKSSPVTSARPRLMELYSFAIDTKITRKEANFTAYNISGGITLDNEERKLYMCIHFIDEQFMKSGPYEFDIEKSRLTSLVPVNYKAEVKRNFVRKIKKGPATDPFFLKPIPSVNSNYTYLVGDTEVYKLSRSLDTMALVYNSTTKEKLQYRIIGVRKLIKEEGIVLFETNYKNDRFILLRGDNNWTEFPINYDALKYKLRDK
jgi:hypothetical protein